MAYKFQLGAAIMSGNLDQTGDLSGSGELAGAELDIANAAFLVSTAGKMTATLVSDLDGGIDVNGSNFTVSAAGAVTAATTATIEGIVSGAAGTFDALAGTSLALQSGGITAAGAVAGATTIAASGLANLDGGIELDNGGNKFTVSTAGAVSASSTLTAEGVVSGAAGTFDALAGTSLALQGGAITAAGAIGCTGLTASAGVQAQGTLEVKGNIFLPGASAAVFSVANDSIYFLDSDGTVKRDTWDDVMELAAGSGITNTNGVLSADSAATPNGIGDLNVALKEGFNYATASLSAARTYTLPSDPSAGDVVHIKLMGGVSVSNYGAITGSAASGFNKYKIDGRSEAIRLESVSGAVSLIWTGTQDVGWAIY